MLRPLDETTLCESIARTHRALVIDEAWKAGGMGAEVSAVLTERAFWELDAPVARLNSAAVPMPYAHHMEQAALPQVDRIVAMARKLMKGAV